MLSALLVVVAVAPRAARADEEATETEAPSGFKFGPFRAHVSLLVMGGYDSNVYYGDPEDAEGPGVIGAPILRIGPRFEAESITTGSVRGRISAGLSWTQYIGNPVAGESDLSADATLDLVFNPDAPLSFVLQEGFVRAIDASYSPTSATTSPFIRNMGARLDRDTNRLALGIRLRPGHGAFQADLLYINTITWYESSALDLGRYMSNTISLASKWKFFPKTAITHEFSMGYIHYFVSSTTAGYANNDSFPLRTLLGVVGLLTPRLEFAIKGGYGNSFHRIRTTGGYGTTFEGPLVVASIAYRAGIRTRFGIYYEHGFSDSIFSNFYTIDWGKVWIDQSFSSRFIIHVEGTVAYLNYDTAPVIPGLPGVPMTDRTELRVGGTARADFWLIEYLALGVSYSIYANVSAWRVTTTAGVDDPSYVKHVILGIVTARY